MGAPKQRKLYLDFLKVLGAFLVIYNHTDGYHYYLNHFNTAARIFITILPSAFTRINVPLFFMISGALLLGKEESYRDLFCKRIARFASVLFLASLMLYTIGHLRDFQLREAILDTLSCSVTSIYWFLFAYLGLLFTLPFLRKIAAAMSGPDFYFLVLCRFVYSCVKPVSYLFHLWGLELFGITGDFYIPFALIDFLFYPLIGYYLDRHISVESIRKVLPWLAMLILADTLISGGITCHLYLFGERTQHYLGIFNFMSAIAVFLIAKFAFAKWEPKLQGTSTAKWLTNLSTLTLGIYLIDPFLKEWPNLMQQMNTWTGERIHIIPLSILYCFVSIAIGACVTQLLKKLPGLKKIL